MDILSMMRKELHVRLLNFNSLLNHDLCIGKSATRLFAVKFYFRYTIEVLFVLHRNFVMSLLLDKNKKNSYFNFQH
jgi:hypothetical protein